MRRCRGTFSYLAPLPLSSFDPLIFARLLEVVVWNLEVPGWSRRGAVRWLGRLTSSRRGVFRSRFAFRDGEGLDDAIHDNLCAHPWGTTGQVVRLLLAAVP